MKDLNKLAEQIIEAVNKTENDYDAKDVVIEILNDFEESYSKQFKGVYHEKV